MLEKKKLLISWAAHTFNEYMAPLISDLNNNFDIVIIIVDYFIPEGLIDEFEDMKGKGKIKSYFIIPEYKKIVQLYRYLKKNTQKLKSDEFDLWLTASEMQIHERYIKEFILPSRCIAIVLWSGTSSILVKNFENSSYNRLKQKVKEKGGIINVMLLSPVILYRRVGGLYIKTVKLIFTFFSRIFLPWLFLRKTFRSGPFDDLTQIGSGRSDVVLFFDHYMAKAHKKLFKDTTIDVVSYPKINNCNCKGVEKLEAAVLSPVSGSENCDIPEKFLKLYLRDFKVIEKELGSGVTIHLRKHPRESLKWPNQLRDCLIANGINALVVGAEKPIRDVMCDYLGVAGIASNSLRDARASCDYGFVVGFEAVSKFRYNEPMYVFGEGEGIEWINENGSYDPTIFDRKKFVPSKKKTVPEILYELSDKQPKNFGDYVPGL